MCGFIVGHKRSRFTDVHEYCIKSDNSADSRLSSSFQFLRLCNPTSSLMDLFLFLGLIYCKHPELLLTLTLNSVNRIKVFVRSNESEIFGQWMASDVSFALRVDKNGGVLYSYIILIITVVICGGESIFSFSLLYVFCR